MPLITLLGDKRVRQHVVDENISKVVWFVVRANIAVQLEIKCIFRYLRSSTPLWIIYLCAMGMSQKMLDLL